MQLKGRNGTAWRLGEAIGWPQEVLRVFRAKTPEHGVRCCPLHVSSGCPGAAAPTGRGQLSMEGREDLLVAVPILTDILIARVLREQRQHLRPPSG
jgi:hypothetical protein